jgi:hypothetical protein
MFGRFVPLLLLALAGAGCQRPATPAVAPGPPPSLTLANFDKVRVGMTLAEVEAILGPPGTTVNADVKGPDGSTTRVVYSGSWFWFRTSTPAGGSWLVTGTNGESRINAVGRSPNEAWHKASEQAAAVGMLAPEPRADR